MRGFLISVLRHLSSALRSLLAVLCPLSSVLSPLAAAPLATNLYLCPASECGTRSTWIDWTQLESGHTYQVQTSFNLRTWTGGTKFTCGPADASSYKRTIIPQVPVPPGLSSCQFFRLIDLTP